MFFNKGDTKLVIYYKGTCDFYNFNKELLTIELAYKIRDTDGLLSTIRLSADDELIVTKNTEDTIKVWSRDDSNEFRIIQRMQTPFEVVDISDEKDMLIGVMKQGEYNWVQTMIFSIEKGGFIFAEVIDKQTIEIVAARAAPLEMKFVKGSKNVKIMNYNTEKCSFHQCLFIGNVMYSIFTFKSNGVNYNKENLRKLIGLLEADDSIAHNAIRILYILVASNYEDLMKIGLEKFGYNYWNYYPEELDPLALALKMNKISMLDVIADYLKDQESMNLTEANLLSGL